MRSTFKPAALFQVTLVAFVALGLSACGSTDPELEPGPDFSDSPLQVQLLFTEADPSPFGKIVFAWEEVDGATHYRFYADLDGDSDADGEPEFVQVGADIPTGTDPLRATVDVSAHLLDWRDARFLLESCDVDGCEEIGRQSVANLSVAYISQFLGGGFVAAVAESGSRIVAGLPGTSLFACEEIFARPADTVFEECEYSEELTEEEVAELELFEAVTLAGSASVFNLVDGSWVQEAVLKASNIGEGDSFGVDVAISDDGNTVVIAANAEDSAATGVNGDGANDDEPNSGAVYVLTRSVVEGEPAWTEVAYLKPSNTQGDPTPDDESLDGDQFGSVIAVSGDGLTVAVSSFGEDSNAMGIDGDGADNSATNSGAVYVFRNAGGIWSQEAYIKPSNTDLNDAFGSSLSLNADGSRLAVGAVRESSAAAGIDGDPFNNERENSGAVYVFEYSGSAWSQQAYIKAEHPTVRDEFGFSVALNGVGDVLAVGSPQEDSNSQGVNGDQANNQLLDYNSGAVYVFEFDGSAWSQAAFLKAHNADPIDELGFSVAINQTGDRVLATSIREGGVQTGINPNGDLDSFSGAGAAYLFVRDGDDWEQQAYIKAPNNSRGNLFGWDSDFGADGDRLIITSFGSSFQPPTVFIF